MTELQKEFEATGYASWVNSDLYPDGKAYTNEYVKWLENKISQQRTEGIREGFEAARTIWAHQDQNVECPVYPTADHYINSK